MKKGLSFWTKLTSQIGANSSNSTNAGLFNLNSNNDVSNANSNVSTLKQLYQIIIRDYQSTWGTRPYLLVKNN